MRTVTAVVLSALLGLGLAASQTLSPTRLGVLYNLDEPASIEVALYYAVQRAIPPQNVLGLHLATLDAMSPDQFAPLRSQALARLPAAVQSLALVWSRPFAVGCMSITSAFAAGYRVDFCPIECAPTPANPLFDGDGWLPADTVGWWPAMLLPTNDVELARVLIRRGITSDAQAPAGTLYLINTQDPARNVRAITYADVKLITAGRIRSVELSTPINGDVPAAIGYFTGARQVDEIGRIHFLPGAAADHLTSTGGVLYAGDQMSALAWIKQGATASYGSVSEPCNIPGKFPSVAILFNHYLRGESVIEAYWKSVAMPGQGLFIGEPLARPFAIHRR